MADVRWHKGQRHYSGTYWAATERGHVIYESRLELARLLFADFDTSVKRIIAQPFLLSAQVEAAVRCHVPDFLLLSDTGPTTIVDVKPRFQLSKPKVSFTLAWTKDVVLTTRSLEAESSGRANWPCSAVGKCSASTGDGKPRRGLAENDRMQVGETYLKPCRPTAVKGGG